MDDGPGEIGRSWWGEAGGSPRAAGCGGEKQGLAWSSGVMPRMKHSRTNTGTSRRSPNGARCRGTWSVLD